MPFQRATKHQAKLRMALIGPSGSGKTYTALAIATNLGQRVALIDTERGSASKYASLFSFDVLELDTYSPNTYVGAIAEAQKEGYDVLVIDSLSHAWSGKDGVLEFVDQAAKRMQSGSSFGAWREATPLHNRLVDAMLGSGMHLIATVRSKTEYSQEKDERGKTVIRKMGLQPVQRDGLEYEFDVIGDLNQENDLIISKTRCPELSGKIYAKAGADVASVLTAWLSDGAPAPVAPAPSQQPAATTVAPPAPKANGNGNGHGTAANAPKPDWKSFWMAARAIGFGRQDVYDFLGTTSMELWLNEPLRPDAPKRTLAGALDELQEEQERREAERLAAAEVAPDAIDTESGKPPEEEREMASDGESAPESTAGFEPDPEPAPEMSRWDALSIQAEEIYQATGKDVRKLRAAVEVAPPVGYGKRWADMTEADLEDVIARLSKPKSVAVSAGERMAAG
jgi:hypothetical protein